MKLSIYIFTAGTLVLFEIKTYLNFFPSTSSDQVLKLIAHDPLVQVLSYVQACASL